MKNSLKTLLLTLVFLMIGNTSQAQFFKKLEEHAKKKIEQEAERRAERRVDKTIDKGFDKTEETIDGKGKKHKKKKKGKQDGKVITNKAKHSETEANEAFPTSSSQENINLPNSYSFDWEYTMKVSSKDGAMDMIYLLAPNAKYLAFKMDMAQQGASGSVISIMDTERETAIMLMDMGGSKFKTTTKLPKEQEGVNDGTDFSIEKIGTKTILGYKCQGFKITSKEGVATIYFAKNTPVSFTNIYASSKKKPKGINPTWFKEFENGLVMEMNFVSSKKEKYNVTMKCISLKKKKVIINIKDYKSSFGG